MPGAHLFQAGYREGITTGKQDALQQGFDQGFAAPGVPIGRALGQLRGVASALLALPNHDDETAAETQAISAALSNVRFADVMPPDVEAEEHARRDREVYGDDVDGPDTTAKTREMDLLEDMVARMNTGTGSEAVTNDRETKGAPRPTTEDVKALKSRLESLATRLGLIIDLD